MIRISTKETNQKNISENKIYEENKNYTNVIENPNSNNFIEWVSGSVSTNDNNNNIARF